MALLRTRAVILRRIPWGDTSWIVHACTEQEGVMGVVARGARRANSPFLGALEPLSQVELVISVRAGRELQNLSQASCLDARASLSRDLVRNATALACAEIVDRFCKEAGSNADVFRLLDETLQALSQSSTSGALFWRFLGGFCEQMGWAMAVDHCAHCGSLDIPVQPALALGAGGFLCDDCAAQSHEPHLPLWDAQCLRWAADPRREVPHKPQGWKDVQRIDDIWYAHLCRNAQNQPRLTARDFLHEVRT